jgi:ribosomal protein S21
MAKTWSALGRFKRRILQEDIIKIKSQQFSAKQGQKKRLKATDADEKRSAASVSEQHPAAPRAVGWFSDSHPDPLASSSVYMG